MKLETGHIGTFLYIVSSSRFATQHDVGGNSHAIDSGFVCCSFLVRLPFVR